MGEQKKMKEKKYKTKEGKDGTEYKLEAGDEFVSKFDSPKTFGNFGKYKIGAKGKKADETIYITLTETQGKKLEKIGQLQGKTIQAYAYDNKYGKQIGVKVK